MIFVVDTARHFEEHDHKLDSGLQFFKTIASQFVISQDMIRVGMVVYSSYSLRSFGLNDFLTNSDVENAILGIEHPPGPGTRNTADALLRAFAMLTNTNTGARTFTEADKVIIILEGLTKRVLKKLDFAAFEMKFRNP